MRLELQCVHCRRRPPHRPPTRSVPGLQLLRRRRRWVAHCASGHATTAAAALWGDAAAPGTALLLLLLLLQLAGLLVPAEGGDGQ